MVGVVLGVTRAHVHRGLLDLGRKAVHAIAALGKLGPRPIMSERVQYRLLGAVQSWYPTAQTRETSVKSGAMPRLRGPP